MKTLLAILLALALAVPAFAQIPGMWERPEGTCTYPGGGATVTDPGNMPIPCGEIEQCIAWDSAGACADTSYWEYEGCVADQDTPEYKAAFTAWFEDRVAWAWCVYYDYVTFLQGALGGD